MYPTRSEWEVILQQASEYAKLYLSNPEVWKKKYMHYGKDMFYDTESSTHMKGRDDSHLIDQWIVTMELSSNKVKIVVDNDKLVKGSRYWKLIDLLWYGTDDYESESDMLYWWRLFLQMASAIAKVRLILF